MKTVRIDDILTKAQMKEVKEYHNGMKKKKTDPMDTEYIKGLKQIICKYKDELLLKGIDCNYLAYVLVYLLHQNPNVF